MDASTIVEVNNFVAKLQYYMGELGSKILNSKRIYSLKSKELRELREIHLILSYFTSDMLESYLDQTVLHYVSFYTARYNLTDTPVISFPNFTTIINDSSTLLLRLGELLDVTVPTPSDKQFLRFNYSSNIWENVSLITGTPVANTVALWDDSDTLTYIPAGTEGQILKLVSGVPEWDDNVPLVTAGAGLTDNSGTFDLGGTLNQDTTLSVTNASYTELFLSLTTGTNSVFTDIYTDTSDPYWQTRVTAGSDTGELYVTSVFSYIQLTESGSIQRIELSGSGASKGMIIYDAINSKGLEYFADYSSNWTDHSLVTKKWVTDNFSAASLQLSDLSDVVSATNTNKFALMANGSTGYIGRALVEADISDFGTYSTDIHANIAALDLVSGTNTGDQTITLTGDVTGSGTGSFTTTIAAAAVDIAMLSATGTANSSTYLRGDNTWATVSSGTTMSGSIVDGILTYTSAGVATVEALAKISGGALYLAGGSVSTLMNNKNSGSLILYGGSNGSEISSSSLASIIELSSNTAGGHINIRTSTAASAKINFYDGTTLLAELDSDTGDWDYQGNNLTNVNSLFLVEQAAADADVASYGQIWVKNDTPNTLWFTNDAGTDIQLGVGGISNMVDDGANFVNTGSGTGYWEWEGIRINGETIITTGANQAWTINADGDITTTGDISAPNITSSTALTVSGTILTGAGSITPTTSDVLLIKDVDNSNILSEITITNILDLVPGYLFSGTDGNNKLITSDGSGGLVYEDNLLYDGTSLSIVGSISSVDSIFLEEKSAANSDVAGKGQLWVKDDTPNSLYFTDDAGTDYNLTGNSTFPTWTPTLYNGTGVTGSSLTRAIYKVIGSYVQFFISGTISKPSGLHEISFSLPVASDFIIAYDVIGSGSILDSSNSIVEPIFLSAYTPVTTDRINAYVYTTNSVTGEQFCIEGAYYIR